MGTYTIGEAAERSGFSASALRYYEGIGLVPTAGRTEAGYRVYDDGSLVRLAFIARAKQLGCSLEEITDLLAIWDDEHCEPVQRRFHDLVTDKIARTHEQVVELTAFASQLQAAAEGLRTAPADGPCDASCACACAAAPPIACMLEGEAVPARLAEWRRVLAGSSRGTTADGARRVELAPNVDLAELASLVAAEQRCCAFFSFTLTVDGRGAGLEVRAPAGAADAVDVLLGAAV